MKTFDLAQIIRPLKQLQENRSRLRRQVQPVALERIAVLEDATAIVDGCLAELAREIPQLHATRRFYDGAWIVGVTTTLSRATRRQSTSSTRFEVSLRLGADGHELQVRTAGSVLDEELEDQQLMTTLDGDGREQLRQLVEAGAMAFAARFFVCTA